MNVLYTIISNMGLRASPAHALLSAMAPQSALALVFIFVILVGLFGFAAIVIRMQRKSDDAINSVNQELEALTSNIPGGVFRFRADESQQMGRLSRGLLKLFECTELQFFDVYKNKFSNIIYEADLERVNNDFFGQIQQKGTGVCDFRVIMPDKSIKWVYCCGRLVTDSQGIKWNYVVLVDTTAQHEAIDQMRISDERLHILMERSENIFFDWDIEADIAVFSEIWHKKFGLERVIECFYSNLMQRGTVHEDDKASLLELLNLIKSGESYGEVEIRIKKSNGIYSWLRFCMMPLKNSQGTVVRASAIAFDIDKEVRKSQEFKSLAERDSLTGLYNKGATEALVKNILETSGTERTHALIIADIDNFKRINDSFGHSFGDKVIANAAKIIASQFRSDDILGRIGGDEFLMFIKDVVAPELVPQKIAELRAAFKRMFDDSPDFGITSSVGAALYSRHGTTYEELFKKADAALYDVKNESKDNFKFYSEGMALDGIGDAPDESESQLNNAEIKFKEELEALISSELFKLNNLAPGETDAASLNAALFAIFDKAGSHYAVDGINVFEGDQNNLVKNSVYEWKASNNGHSVKCVDVIKYEDLKSYMTYVNGHEIFCSSNVSQFLVNNPLVSPGEARACLLCTILHNGVPAGCLTFDIFGKERQWTKRELEAAVYLAKGVGAFMLKRNRRLRNIKNRLLTMSLPDNARPVCVINPKTFDIVLEGAYDGAKPISPASESKCYALYAGADKPCKGCPALSLASGGETTSRCPAIEGANARLIDWIGGRKAILIFMAD